MEKQKLMLVCLILTLFSFNCRLFEYSPNQVISSDSPAHLTRKNLDKLMAQNPGDTIRIVHFSDTHHYYERFNQMIKNINQLEGIDFLVHAGDITDYGLLREFEWAADILASSRYPYFTAIGIHDKVGNGKKAYENIFGELNYYFTYGKFRFVFIDTNPDAFLFNGSIPDLAWLTQALADTNNYVNAIVVFHVPPFYEDFDSTLSEPLCQLLKQNGRVLLCMHGHIHDFTIEKTCSDVPLYSSTALAKATVYWTYKIWPGGFYAEPGYY